MHDHRMTRAPAEGATLKTAGGHGRPPDTPVAALAAADLAALKPAATILLAAVILVGVIAIAAWVWTALRRQGAPAGHEPSAARLALVAPPVRAGDPERPPVLGYVALAAGEHAAELEPMARSIGAWCEERGWRLARVIHDALPEGGRATARPGLAHVLDEIGAGRASGLVVARLRDLSDSVTELGPLLRWFADGDGFVIALDYELDTSSGSGEFAAGALVAISDWERDRIEGRTRAGLDAARHWAAVRDDPELSARIAAMRDQGMSLQAIADALNAKGVPTLRGGTLWRPSSVQAATGYKRPPAAKRRGVELPRGQEADG